MLNNAPKEYVYLKMPDSWKRQVDSQVYGRSWDRTVIYDTPRYKGQVVWSGNEIYGELAGAFDWEGQVLHASSGHKLWELLGIPEDYCIRTGKDGWMKLLTREYFEMWLMEAK